MDARVEEVVSAKLGKDVRLRRIERETKSDSHVATYCAAASTVSTELLRTVSRPRPDDASNQLIIILSLVVYSHSWLVVYESASLLPHWFNRRKNHVMYGLIIFFAFLENHSTYGWGVIRKNFFLPRFHPLNKNAMSGWREGRFTEEFSLIPIYSTFTLFLSYCIDKILIKV